VPSLKGKSIGARSHIKEGAKLTGATASAGAFRGRELKVSPRHDSVGKSRDSLGPANGRYPVPGCGGRAQFKNGGRGKKKISRTGPFPRSRRHQKARTCRRPVPLDSGPDQIVTPTLAGMDLFEGR